MSLSLQSFALAAAARLCSGDAWAQRPEIAFLSRHTDALPHNAGPQALAAYLAAPAPVDQPLVSLGRQIGLTPAEMLAVETAVAVEDGLMAGRAIAMLQAPLGGSRPTIGLLSAMLSELAGHDASVDALGGGQAIESGVLQFAGDHSPLPERSVAVPRPIALALRGRDSSWPGALIGMGETPQTPLPESVVKLCALHGRALSSSSERLLVIRSGSRAEAKSTAQEIARGMGRRPLFIESDKIAGLGPWLFLRGLLPVYCMELGPSERRHVPSISFYTGPVLAVCGPDGHVDNEAGAAWNWTLPVPPREERRQLWAKALGNGQLARELADHYRHGTGRIAHLGRLARYGATLRGRGKPAHEDVRAAAWTGEGAGLSSLAQPLPDEIHDEALVIPGSVRDDLNRLVLRCRSRDGLTEGLGASASTRYRPGVRALFVGPSGTGKTLAAGWLATRLGLPLYRVDLASVTSKYIGETEKNLAQLLARAEQAEVVLLFDEADSLFGKRTDVKEANDRFANAQTNYLLQRIESFDGITILTSNSQGRFDPAFSRRLDAIVDFPLPGPEERRGLWQSHLGATHEIPAADLNRVAGVADLCGGNIRNVVLLAAVLARSQKRPIRYADLAQGLEGEYRKLGRQMPLELKATE